MFWLFLLALILLAIFIPRFRRALLWTIGAVVGLYLLACVLVWASEGPTARVTAVTVTSCGDSIDCMLEARAHGFTLASP